MTTVELPRVDVPAGSSGPEVPATDSGVNAGPASRPRRAREATSAVARKIAGELRVPDIARIDPPCLAAVWRRARWGEQHPADSPARAASYLWAVMVAVPVATGCYLLAWAAERPARTLVAALVVVCTVVVARAWL